MQTFLPYPDFVKTAHVLDWRRLGKQRVESRQIFNTLIKGGGWSKHPAVRMWAGYEEALISYGNVIISEWINRGYQNKMELIEVSLDYKLPPWIGQKLFHASHRSNLLRKDLNYYSQFNWKENPNLPYYWPVKW